MVGVWEGHIDQQYYSVRIGISSNSYDIYVTESDSPLEDTPESEYSYSFIARDVIIGTNQFLLCPSLYNARTTAMLGTNNTTLAAKEDDASLLRYARHEGGCIFYYLDSPTIQTAIDKGIIKGRKSPPPDPTYRYFVVPHVAQFDSDTLARLAEIFSRKNPWHAPIDFTKKTCEQSVPGYPPQGVGSPEP